MRLRLIAIVVKALGTVPDAWEKRLKELEIKGLNFINKKTESAWMIEATMKISIYHIGSKTELSDLNIFLKIFSIFCLRTQ